jgi:hypothetical protein
LGKRECNFFLAQQKILTRTLSNDISLDDQLEDEDDNKDDDCSDNEEDTLDVNIVKSDCKTIALSDIFSAGQVKLEQKDLRKTRRTRDVVDKRTRSFHDSIYNVVKHKEQNGCNMDNAAEMLRRMLDENTQLDSTSGMVWFDMI